MVAFVPRAAAIAALFAVAAPAAQAVPITGGTTRVEVLADLAALGLTPGLLGAAEKIDAAPLQVDFPITGGDLDASLAGQILHEGSGLSLTDGTDTVELANFIIDTVAQLVLADVVANGAPVGDDLPLFSFDLSSVTVAELIDLSNPALELTLTPTAIAALASLFTLPDDLGDFAFGLASTAPDLAVVPAPAAVALFGLGLVGLGLRRRAA
jgi:hypothetical protein